MPYALGHLGEVRRYAGSAGAEAIIDYYRHHHSGEVQKAAWRTKNTLLLIQHNPPSHFADAFDDYDDDVGLQLTLYQQPPKTDAAESDQPGNLLTCWVAK